MLALSKLVGRGRIAACVFAAAAFVAGFPSLTQRAEEAQTGGGSLPALQGEKAVEQLKRTGQYDSLMDAVKAARKDDGHADEPETHDAFGQTAKLLASDGAGGDVFGWSAAISGDTAIVGAYFDTVGANTGQGSAYIFVRSGTMWSEQQKLTATDGAASDLFGFSVAISGETAIVGAYGDNVEANNDQGSAYIFVRSGTTWSQQQKLTASDGAREDNFGWSVAISGETAIVGAYVDNVGANTAQGSAYIFVRSGTTWSEQQQLTAADGATDDLFGNSVAISGETAIVGAWGDDVGGNDRQGSAYIFVRSGTTWSEQQKLTAADGAATDFFGYSVAVSGDTAIVGAYLDSVGANARQGSAYIFVRSGTTWGQQQKLTAADGAANDLFGSSVAISGEKAIVGAHEDNVGANLDQGSAYIFVRSGTTWSEQQKLTASDGAVGDLFGASVAISGETVIVGARWDDVGANGDQGSAYVFRVLKTPFDFDGDGKTDIGIFRPGPGEWWYQRSSDLQVPALQFGAGTDRITPGDFTGDGKADIAFWRPASGEWFILRSEDSSFFAFPFGATGDVPVPAGYDGDGRTDAAVFRPGSATWFILNSGGGGTSIVNFGLSTDKPVVADYDGDGKADIAIFRPSDGSWWYLRSIDSQFRVFSFGVSTDRPVQGDFTGDGKADIAVWRPSTGFWFVQRSEDNSFFSFPFGTTGDIPVAGDYDGDGRQDAAVFRPSTATWFANRSTAGTLIQQFGLSTDTPVPSAFVP